MARFDDWEERLHSYAFSRNLLPFEWGITDCLLTVCDAIEAMTGVDPGVRFRGRYRSQAGARALVALEGFPDLESLVGHVAAQYGFREISPKLAGRGDLVLLDGEQGAAWGIVYLNGREALFASETGLKFRTVLETRRAWRVG